MITRYSLLVTHFALKYDMYLHVNRHLDLNFFIHCTYIQMDKFIIFICKKLMTSIYEFMRCFAFLEIFHSISVALKTVFPRCVEPTLCKQICMKNMYMGQITQLVIQMIHCQNYLDVWVSPDTCRV